MNIVKMSQNALIVAFPSTQGALESVGVNLIAQTICEGRAAVSRSKNFLIASRCARAANVT